MDPEYVDTGLGWSAKSNWLRQSATALGLLSVFGGGAFPDQPIPKGCETNDAVLAAGFLVGEQPAYTAVYYVGTEGDANVVVYFPSTMDGHIHFISTSNTEYVRLIRYRSDQHVIFASDRKLATNAVTIDGVTVYHGTLADAGFAQSWQQYFKAHVPVFSSDSAADDSLVIATETYFKFNAGFGVCCVAKWVNLNQDIVYSPIVISSKSDYTVISLDPDDIVGDILTTGILYQGIRFYLTLCTPLSQEAITGAPGIEVADFTETDPGGMDITELFKKIASIGYAGIKIYHAPDPYSEEGADSGEEGGDGEDLEDDEMGISHHAIPAAINTGFCRIYCPNEQQLRALSNFLWSAQYDLTAVKKLFANPMDSVLGLSAVPLTLSGANMPVYLGGVDTEMSFPMVSYQSYQVPMGAITVEKRWGSYLDYDPYTRFSIFLPFIGFKDLSADDIMGKQIILDYDVDILSGACTARLQAGGNVLYQWSGQCSIQLPVTASNWNQVFQGATSAALSAGLAVATGSAGPVLAGALAAEGVQAIMGKPRIERGGTASGAAGWMGGLTPYLVRVTPQAITPDDQNMFIGYPAFSSISLGALSGYNEISSIHLEGIPATGAELEELEAILKGGVIF